MERMEENKKRHKLRYAKLAPVGGKVTWKAEVNITVASEDNPLNETDHAIRIVDRIPDNNGGYRSQSVIGKAPIGENVIYLSQSILDNSPAETGRYAGTGKSRFGDGTLKRTVSHELGHSAGLNHPYHSITKKDNLMHQSMEQNAGMNLTKGQIRQIKRAYDKGILNQGRQR